VLSDGERERAARIVAPRAAERFATTRACLRLVLAERLGLDPARVGFTAGEQGKPALAGDERWRFNVAHSGTLAAIALSDDREVGVDVERVDERRPAEALARRALPPEAQATLQGLTGRALAEAFTARWAEREALVKAAGTGLAGPATTGFAARPLPVPEGYAGAVAAEGDDWPLRTGWWRAPGAS
jgi:4'-phosphopantetheinyl transferase